MNEYATDLKQVLLEYYKDLLVLITIPTVIFIILYFSIEKPSKDRLEKDKNLIVSRKKERNSRRVVKYLTEEQYREFIRMRLS